MADEHKGLPVDGYAPTQSAKAVAAVNENKRVEERLLRRLDAMMEENTKAKHRNLDHRVSTAEEIPYDPRWLSVARTHFEEGFMAMNRAIFKPGRVKLPEDEEDGA